MSYGLKEYKDLLEKNFEDLNNPLNVPCSLIPYTIEAKAWQVAKQESINYAIEMLPEIKEPMKDHVFREEVNHLTNLAYDYAETMQLRERMRMFLQSFKDKVSQ